MMRAARSILAGYRRDFTGLREAADIEALRAWFDAKVRTTFGFGFNGDVIRARIVADAFKAASCTRFLETGTYRGATTVLAARLLGCPVFSCELDKTSWMLSKLRCAPFPNAAVLRADSRAFLREMRATAGPHDVPFIYLDAHWYADLPLQQELDFIVESWPHCIVLIDDFQVPGRPGFKYDRYGADVLCIEKFAIRPRDGSVDVHTYFPDYDAAQETGARCGFVLFASGIALETDGAAAQFSLNMLKRHNTGES